MALQKFEIAPNKWIYATNRAKAIEIYRALQKRGVV